MTNVMDSGKLDSNTLAEIRAALETERDTILRQLESHAAGREDRPSATDSFGETEHLSLIEQQDVMGMLDTMSRNTLAEAVKALARIEEGTYGDCTSCGEPIPVERLEAMPTSALCIQCKLASEAG